MTLSSYKIPLEQDAAGVIHVADTRVTLDSIVFAFREGASAEEIAERFPVLPLSAVYAAITFYLQNQTEVDSYLKRREAEAEQLRTEIESHPEALEFRARLRERMTSERKP
jgi:uncharacterized protein (DUF433 family)